MFDYCITDMGYKHAWQKRTSAEVPELKKETPSREKHLQFIWGFSSKAWSW